MSKWMVMAKKANFYEIGSRFGISPIVARIIRNRDIIENQEITKFLNGTLEDLYSPYLLKDCQKGISILQSKIQSQSSIRIIGDYDIDGICSTYILKRGIEYCGGKVDTTIPHRMRDGYGINEALIQEAKEADIDTIVTCDNGIAAEEQIAYAKSLGMTVILTDHHQVPFEETDGIRCYKVPPADAVINPKQEDCSYPFSEICGAVVAWKVIQALVKQMGKDEAILDALLELAAFATIGDVMELKDENRIIVKYGLSLLANTGNCGLRALMDVNEIDRSKISPYHIGFILGPCINATGRLDAAKRALDLLEAPNQQEAALIAGDLKALNDSRKEMTQMGLDTAIHQIESTGMEEMKVLVIYLPDCHESLAGIIAGRIKEKYKKPTFVITKGEESLKGSGRSIDAYHMYDKMSEHKELFLKYGGHKLAAGLSIKEENLSLFRELMNSSCELKKEDFQETIRIDMVMPFAYANMELLEQMHVLEPFGMGNPKPIFAQKEVTFLKGTILGKNKNVGKYRVKENTGECYEMIYFGNLDNFHLYLEHKYGKSVVDALYQTGNSTICISVLYYPSINEYNGRKTIQLVMQDYQ